MWCDMQRRDDAWDTQEYAQGSVLQNLVLEQFMAGEWMESSDTLTNAPGYNTTLLVASGQSDLRVGMFWFLDPTN